MNPQISRPQSSTLTTPTTTRRAFLPVVGSFLGLLGIRASAAAATPPCMTPQFVDLFGGLGSQRQQVIVNLVKVMVLPEDTTGRELFTDEQWVHQQAFEQWSNNMRGKEVAR